MNLVGSAVAVSCNASVKIVEVPSGSSVMSPTVVKVYGLDIVSNAVGAVGYMVFPLCLRASAVNAVFY